MASKKNRVMQARRRRHARIDPTELAPAQAAGLTQGAAEHGELETYGHDPETGAAFHKLPGERGAHAPSGLEAMQHMNDNPSAAGTRVPRPHFVAETDVDGLVRQAPDGRRFADVRLTFPEDVLSAIRSHMMCLKCLEPQPFENADRHVPGCEGAQIRGPRYMRDGWQSLDLAMEFEGKTHIGPAKPLAEWDAEIEERRLKHQHDSKILKGGSRGVRKSGS